MWPGRTGTPGTPCPAEGWLRSSALGVYHRWQAVSKIKNRQRRIPGEERGQQVSAEAGRRRGRACGAHAAPPISRTLLHLRRPCLAPDPRTGWAAWPS